MESVQIITDSLELTFNRENGALYGIRAPETGWEILNRPETGLSWRIMLPLSEERRNNNIYGEKQKPACCYAPVTVIAKKADGSAFGQYRLVDAAVWKPAAVGIEIPARSAAVLIP